MRITNGIMMNNTLNNINRNKIKMDTLNTQLATESKIQRPSDDPIIAIRALRFRSTLSEINQYVERNIPDAESWLQITDDALGNVVKVVSDITTYCNQAVNGYYDNDDKRTIVETLKAFRSQVYTDANTDCAGRTIFTGYKTDKTLTFIQDEPQKSYKITEEFNAESFEIMKKVSDSVDISGLTVNNVGALDTSTVPTPGYEDAYRVRLGYNELEDAGTQDITYYNFDADGNKVVQGTKAVQVVDANDTTAYNPADDAVHFIPETGEYIFGKDAYAELTGFGGFDITYTKTGFEKDELDPIHYFDCTDLTDGKVYTANEQPIEYEVNFNQNLQINVQGCNVLKHSMVRDIDDIIDAVNDVSDIENKIKQLDFMAEGVAEGSEEEKKINFLKENCERELDFAKDKVEKMFSAALTKFQEHQDNISKVRSDIGARETRLELTSDRLSVQKKTIESLKSVNEEVDVTEIAVEFREAESIYDASLAAAGKVVQNKLIDFV